MTINCMICSKYETKKHRKKPTINIGCCSRFVDAHSDGEDKLSKKGRILY